MLGDMEEVQSGNIYFFNLLTISSPNTDTEIHFHVNFTIYSVFYNLFSQNRRNREIFLFF